MRTHGRHAAFLASVVLIGLATATGAIAAAQEQLSVVAVKAPPTEGGNPHYVSNRPPLLPSPLIKLPIGSVRPEGWVRGQLELMAEGMTGKLTEISPWCTFEGNAWTDPKGQGKYGWEEVPYWLKGFTDLGYVLQNERIIKEANRWLDAVMAGQRPDGYFGDEKNRAEHDLWPNMPMLHSVRSLHEATGDKRVIPFMLKYFKWQASLPIEDFLPGSWQKVRAGDNLDSIYWLYNRTGETWLLDLAKVNHDCTADWMQTMASWHGVNIAQCFREPAEFYQQNHDPRYLRAAERNYDAVTGIYGMVPGGLYGSDENCRPGFIGPRQGTETCTMVELMYSHEILAAITGNSLWADRCEDVAFNSLPCSMTPELKGLHYLTAPNQVQLDRANKAPMIQNGGDMFTYTPYEQYRCCQHNVAFGWPYFSEHLWMATQESGLAAVMYAACTVKAKVGRDGEVTIRETTDYPFSEVIRLEISASQPVSFPLMLRVPGWCGRPGVKVNGREVTAQAAPRTWIILKGEWKSGDVIELTLPMETRVRVWAKNGNTISVDRGPLTYSLKIGERWAKYDNGKPWAAYEVFPTTPWNYGLAVDAKEPASSLEVVRTDKPLAAQPFTPDAAPIMLKAKGRKIPAWTLEYNGMIGQIPQSPIDSTEPQEDLTLIPMGCTRLRVSVFPQVIPGTPPVKSEPVIPGVQVSASHVNPPDTLAAVNDGKLPQTSNDASIPRFTWWDRKGTGEWVQYTFEKPRTISSCEVYWFDDRGGGACRVPIGWRLVYRDERGWHQVADASAYGIERNKFNRVTFKPVTTTTLRLIADLNPEFSGGILEWRVGEESAK